MLTPGSLLSLDWYKSQDAKEIMAAILHKNLNKRKNFGLLERPMLPPQSMLEEVKYKIYVSGKSGVGKTSTVANLAGHPLPSQHCETSGIQTTIVHWPAKILQLNKTLMFQLQLWEAGENAIKKFDHVLPACTEKVDGIIFLFSFVDKSSFDDLPQQLARLSSQDDDISKLVLGTKFDQHAQSEITQREIRDFEQRWNIPVLKICNVPDNQQNDFRTDLSDVAPILNAICERLWHRELQMVNKTENRNPNSGSKMSYL